ncbi:retrovirus-related pol polyprotein from transposon tnt 1-94 [Trifolium medium]|uniref:Retrovirus-related pol polyprotein from transposon tnt 1-94 n=1 Tax=Trifolium medium TaxID=97028 RepID=A0A392MEX2_9FABA|nr:retrovirus-related pol polyprotein from transposon tnt 1-94 [Trifolium medium]
MRGIQQAISANAIRGIPKLSIDDKDICGDCQKGKQTKMSHPKLHHLVTSRVLELLHMDLMGPMQVESNSGSRYAFVVVDDYSRYTWIKFIREKSDTFEVFKDLCIQLQREKDLLIVKIRSDHGREFENARFNEFCTSEGIKHEFSSAITPQQNGVVERKNRTIQESARVMLHAKNPPYHFWAEAMHTACYILNRVTLRKGTTSTLYELWKGRKPTVKYFHVFGSKCYILADREQRRKLNPKSDEGIFLGYSSNSRAYRVFNSRTKAIMESINVIIDDMSTIRNPDVEIDDLSFMKTSDVADDVATPTQPESPKKNDEAEGNSKELEPEPATVSKGPSIRIQKNHPIDLIIGDPVKGVTTRRSNDAVANSCFVSRIEPKNVKEALTDEFWIEAMQEELNQFKRNEYGVVTRNKERLVAQGYTQVEGLDFDETFAPVARLESIRLLLGLACLLKFKLFQMDVKSAFLNWYLHEEDYVEQPKGFIDPIFPNHVYKLKKAVGFLYVG